jgi:putative ABC transport system permease protein
MGPLLQDLRFAFRMLRKSSGFTAVAVLTLALGIGANTAIFSVIYASILAPMPFSHPEELAWVWSKAKGGDNVVSAGDFLDWKRESTVFQDLAAWSYSSFNLGTPGHVEEVTGSEATPTAHNMMLVPMALGRDFVPEEGEPGRDHVVTLSNRLWRKSFGSDPKIIGKQIHLNGEPYTVVGVWEPGMLDRAFDELSVPLVFKPDQINHDFHWLSVMGRLKPGVSVKQAQADMDVVATHIAEAYPKSNKGWGASVELYQRYVSPALRASLFLLMGSVGFVLLIACANVANLLLARGMSRQTEVAVRAALGATRGRLFSQFLAESIILAVVGGACGIGIGWIVLKVFTATMPAFTLPMEANVGLNAPVLAFTLAATILAGVLFGCAPAWQATRLNLSNALKEGGRATVSASRKRVKRALVVLEFALASTAAAGAGLMIHSLWNLKHVDIGADAKNVLTFFLPVPETRFSQPAQMTEFYREMLDRIESTPGVYRATVSTGMPLQGAGFGMPFNIAGKPSGDPSSRPSAGFQMVSPGYFDTFGIQMEKGRSFTNQDTEGSLRVAIVSEDFAKRFLAGTDPLTQSVMVEQLVPGVTKLGPPVEWQIVGVAHDVKNGDLRGEQRPLIYVPFWQSPWPQAGMAVRGRGNVVDLRKSVQAAVQSVDPNLPLADVETMKQVLSDSLSGDSFDMALFTSFAGLALLLAALGIYGVIAFSVVQRTHEIGLRMALGASRGRIFRLVLKEGFLLAVTGLIIGSVGAYAADRLMGSLLYEIGRVDPLAFGAVCVVLLLSALLACYIPARRAMNVDPMVALRYE